MSAKTFILGLITLLVSALVLAACGSGGDQKDAQASATLPPPQVRIEMLPSPTLQPDDATPPPEATGTLEPTAQVQAWPTLDEEQYLLGLIDQALEKIERRLNNTDTEIRP